MRGSLTLPAGSLRSSLPRFLRAGLLVAFGSAAALGCVCEKRRPGGGAPQASAEASAAAARTPAVEVARGDVVWGAQRWVDWSQARQVAQAEKKPILLIIYTNRSPEAHVLARRLDESPLREAAQGLVLVHVDQDELPDELQLMTGDTGRYVPRALFLDAAGLLNRTLRTKSGDTSYYYANFDELADNMRRAAAEMRPE